MIISTKKHVYDIDLKEIFRQYCHGMQEVAINSHHSKDYHIEHLRTNIENLCIQNKIDFDLNPYIILTEKDNDAYWQYLAVFLLFLKPEKINLVLEDRLKKCSGRRQDFINSVEFYVLDAIRSSSIFENSSRINKVARWVEQKKKIFRKETVKPVWKSKYYAVLKKLSEELHIQGYTKRKDDFHDVFVNGKVITWKNGPESLVYLLNKLRNPPLAYITTSKGDHPFYKAIEPHFKFYDNEKRLIFRNDLRKVLDSMYRKSFNKFIETRSAIDEIIRLIKK